MVSQFYDRHDCLCGSKNRKKHRAWPKSTPEERLRRWFERTAKRSAFMRTAKQETPLRLPLSILKDLGLASPLVVIVDTKSTIELLSTECEFPLAVVRR